MKQPPFATESFGAQLDRLYFLADGSITREPPNNGPFMYGQEALVAFRTGRANGRIPKGYVLVGAAIPMNFEECHWCKGVTPTIGHCVNCGGN